MSERERRQRRHRERGDGTREGRGCAIVEQRAKRRQPHHVERRAEGSRIVGSPCNRAGISRKRRAPPLLERDCHRIGAVGRLEHRVDDELLVLDAERLELARRPIRLTQRSAIGPRDEHEGRARSVAQRLDCSSEPGLLHLESRVRAEARRALGGRFEEAGPGARQAQKPQGVSGRRRVEQHVIERHAPLVACQEFRELVERGDLDCARAGELFAQLVDLALASRHRDTARSRARDSRLQPSRDRC